MGPQDFQIVPDVLTSGKSWQFPNYEILLRRKTVLDQKVRNFHIDMPRLTGA